MISSFTDQDGLRRAEEGLEELEPSPKQKRESKKAYLSIGLNVKEKHLQRFPVEAESK